MLSSHKAAIAQELMETGLLLFVLSALPLKFWNSGLTQGITKKTNMSLAIRGHTSLQTTSVLRGNVMEVKVHTRESHPHWQVLFWTWIKEHSQDRQLLELPKSRSPA